MLVEAGLSRIAVFNRTTADVDTGAVYLRSFADATNPPLKVWTHLSAVFDTKRDTDKTNDTIQLFVNGRPQGQPVMLNSVSTAYQPWVSSGGLQFGRSRVGGNFGEFFRGRLDEINVWQRVLQPDEIAQQAMLLENGVPANELVAHWDAASSTGTAVKEVSSYPAPNMSLSSSGATLDAENNALVLDGTAGYAAATGPVTDESGSFTATARVTLDSAKLAAKPVGYQAQVAAQQASSGESSWALWVVKPADGVYQWKFTRTAVGSDDKVTQSAEVPGGDIAETDTWVQVDNVSDLNTYASVTRLLGTLPGVTRIELEEAAGASATWHLVARGGAEAVERALSGASQLTRAGAANGRLLYSYRP